MRSRALWLVALVPASIGAGVALLVGAGLLERHILYLRADLGTISLLIGLSLSAGLFAFFLYRARVEVNARRAVAAAQAQAVAERRRFVQRLDHELKNPLTAIRAGLANLNWRLGAEARRQVVESVEAQTIRLSRLASDLRKLAELETRPLERSPVEIGPLLQEAVNFAHERPESFQRRLTLAVPQAPWPLPAVEGDYDLLFLAVHNLVDNAFKFTGPGDTVEIRAFEDRAQVVVEIADTGPGIPGPEVEHIWDELYRGEGARGVPGSGLGLALVRAIVERHGGEVSVRSRTGQGTVFALRLPVSAGSQWRNARDVTGR